MKRYSYLESELFYTTFCTLFQKKCIITDIPDEYVFNTASKNSQDDTLSITKRDLEDMLNNLFIPMKTFFVFRYYEFFAKNHCFEKEITRHNLNYEMSNAFLSMRKNNILKMKDYFKKEAYEIVFKIFFLSFFKNPHSNNLENFDLKGYDNFVYKIHKNYPLSKKENIYTTKELIRFLFLASSFKDRPNIKNPMIGFALPFMIGNEAQEQLLSDLFYHKDKENFLKTLENSLDVLEISSQFKDRCLVSVAKTRGNILREKIKLFGEKELMLIKK